MRILCYQRRSRNGTHILLLFCCSCCIKASTSISSKVNWVAYAKQSVTIPHLLFCRSATIVLNAQILLTIKLCRFERSQWQIVHHGHNSFGTLIHSAHIYSATRHNLANICIRIEFFSANLIKCTDWPQPMLGHREAIHKKTEGNLAEAKTWAHALSSIPYDSGARGCGQIQVH